MNAGDYASVDEALNAALIVVESAANLAFEGLDGELESLLIEGLGYSAPIYHLRNPLLQQLRSWPVQHFESIRFYFRVENENTIQRSRSRQMTRTPALPARQNRHYPKSCDRPVEILKCRRGLHPRTAPSDRLFRFSVKRRGERSPLVSIPPLWGGDFQGIRVYRSDVVLGGARNVNFRAPRTSSR